MGNLNSDVELLSRLSPSDIELVFRRLNEVIGIIVSLIMKLGIGGVDSLVHAELVQVRPIRGLEPSAAVVLGIAVVIRDSFAVKIETRAFYSSGNFLRAASRAAVR